jgi:hypothetical protein
LSLIITTHVVGSGIKSIQKFFVLEIFTFFFLEILLIWGVLSFGEQVLIALSELSFHLDVDDLRVVDSDWAFESLLSDNLVD